MTALCQRAVMLWCNLAFHVSFFGCSRYLLFMLMTTHVIRSCNGFHYLPRYIGHEIPIQQHMSFIDSLWTPIQHCRNHSPFGIEQMLQLFASRARASTSGSGTRPVCPQDPRVNPRVQSEWLIPRTPVGNNLPSGLLMIFRLP